jgi:dihydrofolate reductase
MSRVIADISMSLDGFVTGPDPGPEQGLGVGGESLHTWAMAGNSEVDQQVLQEGVDASGAVILGRRLFDVVDAPDGWNEDMGYGAEHAAQPPMFVVTHRPPSDARLPFWTFVDSVEAAVDQAKAAAGGRDVVAMGGADVIRQLLAAGLIDRLQIHLAPVLLGGGTALFGDGPPVELEQVEVRVSPFATHLSYVPKAPPAEG